MPPPAPAAALTSPPTVDVEAPALPGDNAPGPVGGTAPTAEVAGANEFSDQPGATLPRTGGPAVPLAATGLWAIAAGALARGAAGGLRRLAA